MSIFGECVWERSLQLEEDEEGGGGETERLMNGESGRARGDEIGGEEEGGRKVCPPGIFYASSLCSRGIRLRIREGNGRKGSW
jgi:hypothetical protein